MIPLPVKRGPDRADEQSWYYLCPGCRRVGGPYDTGFAAEVGSAAHRCGRPDWHEYIEGEVPGGWVRARNAGPGYRLAGAGNAP